MNKQDFIKRIVEMFESGIEGIQIETWQQRPYTAVKLTYQLDVDHKWSTFGFSKVNWPDDWDEGEGVYLCLRKAAAQMWREIYLTSL